MKTLFLALILLSFSSSAQMSTQLDINNIDARINADGVLFSNYDDAKFEVPKGSGVHAVFVANLWIGGIDIFGNLHLAANTYAGRGRDFWFGPITQNYDFDYEYEYGRVWKINRATIEAHILDFQDVNYTVPAAIAEWPANPTDSVMSTDLAPFRDVNGNKLYDPENGDFPIIRGDQAVFFMFNDDAGVHATGGLKMGIEVHGLAWAQKAAAGDPVDNTVFVNYRIINRSDRDYKEVYIGAFADMDLGCYQDDFIGCDTILNCFFNYNGDAFDEDCGSKGYGNSPPAVGVTVLNHKLFGFREFRKDFSGMGQPYVADQYYPYLQGYWIDGNHITYGGIGYGGSIPTNFMYPGNPNDSTQWSEESEGNSPFDRSGLATIGPFDLNKSGELCLDLAFTYARDYQASRLGNLDLLKQEIIKIQTFYDLNIGGCNLKTTGIKSIHPYREILIYPNPSTGNFTIQSPQAATLKLFNIQGQLVRATSIEAGFFQWDLSAQPKGIYILKAQTQNTVKREKLVLQ